MKVLLMGHSRIAQRRVLPALRSLREVEAVVIASRRGGAAAAFDDYASALAQSGAEVAYISLENAAHALWAERALQQGMHVVLDKPAFLSEADAVRLAALAESKACCLAEATVFPYHPQIEAVHRVFARTGSAPMRVTALFSFPPLDAADFRYRRDQGGGALFDLGPYVAATSRIFFGRPPRTVSCETLARRADGLDIAFSVLLSYHGGGALAGHFGFDTEYQNRLLASGAGAAVELNRAFTLPAESGNALLVRTSNAPSELPIAPADSFALFMTALLRAISARAWHGFTRALLEDAALLARMRLTSGDA